MRIRAILLATALAACVQPIPSATDAQLAETDEPILCGSLCDPGHDTYDDALYGAHDYGLYLFSDAISTGQSCFNLGTGGAQQWDCMVTFTTDKSPCKNFIVECFDANGSLSCNHRASNCQF